MKDAITLSREIWPALKKRGATFTPAEFAPVLCGGNGMEYQVVFAKHADAFKKKYGGLCSPYFGGGGASNCLMALRRLGEMDGCYFQLVIDATPRWVYQEYPSGKVEPLGILFCPSVAAGETDDAALLALLCKLLEIEVEK